MTLMLAWRRQQSTEHDAAERRLTELYLKAVEQLGSDKAPVRHGALYALERVAQDNPEHRQTVVNVLCAYLRAPFTPPADTANAHQHRGLAVSPRRPRAHGQTPRRLTIAPPTSGQDERRQEREVRLTAQRILTRHLYPGDHPRRPTSTFWADIDLDLTDATLIDFDLAHCQLRNGRFDGATFLKDGWFYGVAFTGEAWFTSAIFARNTEFTDATFGASAHFSGAHFTGHAHFGHARFTGRSRFYKATFGRAAWFYWATFLESASFADATIEDGVDFTGVKFCGPARFRRTALAGSAKFDEVLFSDLVSFDNAAFSGESRFHEARFSGDATWDEARFEQFAAMEGARVVHGEFQRSWPIGWSTIDAVTDQDGASAGLVPVPVTLPAAEGVSATEEKRTRRY